MLQNPTCFDVFLALLHRCQDFFLVGEKPIHAFLGEFVRGTVDLSREMFESLFQRWSEVERHR